MKIRLLLILFLVATYSCASSQVLYSSINELGTRFNLGLGRSGTPKIAFDDISIPNNMVTGGDSIAVTKVKVGLRRAPGAPAVDVKIYYTPFDDTSTQLGTYIKIPPVLLGTVSLPANPSSLLTTVISIGDSVSTLFKLKTDTNAVYPGYQTFFIGASLSSDNPANGLRFTSAPKINSNHIWIYDADSTISRFEGHFDNIDASFYIQVFGHSQTTLPVTLVRFVGEHRDGANVLTWTTETEVNNKGYELQRATDGVNFSPVNFTNSKAINGNSISKLTYEYIDENAGAGNNYYRLKQVDNDGHSNLSSIVFLKNGDSNLFRFSNIYPNPVKSVLNVVIVSVVSEKVNMIVTDYTGQIVMRRSEKLIKGSNNLSLDVSKLSTGSYTIKVVGESKNAVAIAKFIKQ